MPPVRKILKPGSHQQNAKLFLREPSGAYPEVDLSRWRSPFSFSITRSGSLYVFLVFLIALAAVNTGNNLLYLILAMLLAATAVAGVVARLSLRSIFVSLQVPQNVFERENVSIKISLRNQKRWLSSFSILVEDLALIRTRRGFRTLRKLKFWQFSSPPGTDQETPVLHHAAYFAAIPPGEVRAELITQSFDRRGRYHLEGMRLSTEFPFGFFRRGERVSVSGEVLVYPSIREISSDLHLLPFLPGKLEGKRPGHGESLYAIRMYREGESARLIHWKATAKTGKLMAREYAREEESEFCLILDTAMHSPQPDSANRFEKAVSLAASLAAHFVNEAAEFEYLTPREYIPRGTGTEHLYRILRSLAVVKYELATGPGAGDPPGSAWPGKLFHPAGDGNSSHGSETDLSKQFAENMEKDQLTLILSEKVFKIILTSRPRGMLPAPIWHSSYVIYFDEL
ncbi:MAG: DUF58 domain-containing protein [Acidobacteriota bacterium]|jgi:uncharacterized protein (DUF58 family)